MKCNPVKIIRRNVIRIHCKCFFLNPTNRKSNTNSKALNVLNWDLKYSYLPTMYLLLHSFPDWFSMYVCFCCKKFAIEPKKIRFWCWFCTACVCCSMCSVRFYAKMRDSLICVIQYLWIRGSDLVSNFQQIICHGNAYSHIQMIIANIERKQQRKFHALHDFIT